MTTIEPISLEKYPIASCNLTCAERLWLIAQLECIEVARAAADAAAELGDGLAAVAADRRVDAIVEAIRAFGRGGRR